MNKVSIREFRGNLSKYIKESKKDVVYITCRGMIVTELSSHTSVHKSGEIKEVPNPSVHIDKSSAPPDAFKELKEEKQIAANMYFTKQHGTTLKDLTPNTYSCGCKKGDFKLCPKHKRS